MSALRINAAVLCIAVCACGGGDTTAEPEPISKIEIISSYPADGSENVSTINSLITVQTNLALDPASVNSNNVHLMPGEGNQIHDMLEPNETEYEGKLDAVPGQVAYDAITKIISFAPSRELNHGVSYHLRVHNVRLLDGTPLESGKDTVQFSFTTAHQILKEKIKYYIEGENLGDVSSRSVYSYSVNGELKRTTIYRADGSTSGILKYRESLPTGELVQRVKYAGEETSILSYRKNIKDNLGNVAAHVTFINAGNDRIWGTDDDLFHSYTDNKHQHNQHQISTYYVLKSSFRSEGIRFVTWDQKDEYLEPQFVSLLEHRGSVFAHRHIYYSNLGSNGEIDFDPQGDPVPIDDVVTVWYKRDFDRTTGLRTAVWAMEGNTQDEDRKAIDAGKNNNLFGSNNGVKKLNYYNYKASTITALKQMRDNIYTYNSPGPDNNWETMVDNDIESYITYEYDENDFLIKQSHFIRNEEGQDILSEEKLYASEL